MRKLCSVLALCAVASGAQAQSVDQQVLGAIVGGVVLNELFRGAIPPNPRAQGPYGYGASAGRRDPNRICGYTPIYHPNVVEIVATNCWGEVVGRTVRPR
jgi:hypothetical protein